MKVLLISANKTRTPYPVYPLGLDYVAGAISDAHTVKIADMNGLQYAELGALIQTFEPEVIGLSLRNVDSADTTAAIGYIDQYRYLVHYIRTCFDANLILGGSGFSIFPHEIMAELDADYGIIGEGERLRPLLDVLERNGDAARIPGVILPNTSHDIPAPWDGGIVRAFTSDYTHVNTYLQKGGILNLQTKRGCRLKCIYCTYPHLEGRQLRLFEPDEVADTALMLQQAGAKYFFVADAAFNSDVSHSIAVAESFIRAGVCIPWGAYFTPLKPSSGYYDLLASAGLTHVEFGTEALSEEMLAVYRKPFRVEHVFDAHRQAVAAGLNVAHFFLLGGPGESPATVAETLAHADTLERTVLFFFCSIRIYPYTELYQMAVEQGQISADSNIVTPVFYQPRDISSTDIVQHVRQKARGRVNWIIGGGNAKIARLTARMYDSGYFGPLWEYLIR